MKAALRKKRTLLRILYRRSIDPGTQVAVLVETILIALLEGEFGPTCLSDARHALSVLRRLAHQVNQMSFWRVLTIPKTKRASVRVTTGDQRSMALHDLREELPDFSTRGEVLEAMYTLHWVVASMHQMFAAGRVATLEKDAGPLDRYKCGVLLPAFVNQFERFWQELPMSFLQKEDDA